MNKIWNRGIMILLIAVLMISVILPALAATNAKIMKIKDIKQENLKEEIKVLDVKVIKAEMRQAGEFQTNYVFDIADDTGRITVLTMKNKYPPVVGTTLKSMTGVLTNDPNNATQFMLLETGRGPGAWLEPPRLYILIGIGVLLILIIVLIVLFMKEKQGNSSEALGQGFVGIPPGGNIGTGGGYAVSGISTIGTPPPMPLYSTTDPEGTIIKPKTESAVAKPSHLDDSTIPVSALKAEVQVISGPDTNKTYSIIGKETRFGRVSTDGGRKNDIVFSDKTVSRDHAKVIYNDSDKTYTLINESSNNPTKVNDKAEPSIVLNDGDEIEFGTTKVRFYIKGPKNAK